MPNVILRNNENGQLTCYVAKKDLEDVIVSMEHEGPDTWGGEFELSDGSKYYFDPMPEKPRLPVTVRAKRAGGE